MKNIKFIICLIATLFLCIGISIFCVFAGQTMASTHLEPQYALRDAQIILAAIVTIILALIKYTRKIYWFSIPTILLVFAFIYVFIVNQYPCCSGG